MMKRIVPLGLLLPIVACGAAKSSESTQSVSSDLSIDAGSVPGECTCIGDSNPSGSVPTPPPKDRCPITCPVSAESITIAPGQEQVAFMVSAGVDWPDPAHVTFSIAGLPQGVTAQWQQTSGYIYPAQGVTGAYLFTASLSAPQTTTDIIITAQSGGDSGTARVALTVGGTCVPYATCEGRCGTIDDGCSATIVCGACPAHQTCDANQVCQTPSRCMHGTHDCGDGTCMKICY